MDVCECVLTSRHSWCFFLCFSIRFTYFRSAIQVFFFMYGFGNKGGGGGRWLLERSSKRRLFFDQSILSVSVTLFCFSRARTHIRPEKNSIKVKHSKRKIMSIELGKGTQQFMDGRK